MKRLLVFMGAVAVLAVAAAVFWPQPPPRDAELVQSEFTEPTPLPAPVEPVPRPPTEASPATQTSLPPPPPEMPPAPLSKTERLAQLRDAFRALAVGDPRAALRAAQGLTNDVEREAALLTLVTEWKQGEMASPRQRAWAIASLGLEAGLGAELAGNPELAQLWAAELTNAQGRAVSPERLGPAMFEADPAAALAYAAQFSPEERRKFLTSAFSNWARRDTEAALQWAEEVSDPAERALAVEAIRSVAPVGIGVELATQEGAPVVQRIFPGMPAELSGQLHAGDRILAVSQGNNVFVDARGLSMQDLVQAIRGPPGSMVQLRILPADSPPDSPPRTVAIFRGQFKFKQ